MRFETDDLSDLALEYSPYGLVSIEGDACIKV